VELVTFCRNFSVKFLNSALISVVGGGGITGGGVGVGAGGGGGGCGDTGFSGSDCVKGTVIGTMGVCVIGPVGPVGPVELDGALPLSPPPDPLTPGGVKVEGARTGAVPPDAIAICLGLSSFRLSLTSVPFTALATCVGTLLPVLTAGGDGGPPPGGVIENCPGGTGTVFPADEKSTWPWVPMLLIPLTPLT
jgi:hypothetical protein